MSHKADAETLHKAVKGTGTDEKALISVIGHRSKEDLAKIAAEYESQYKSKLINDIRGDTSYNFNELLCLRIMPRAEARKWLLTKATKGAGTAEKYLVDVLGPATNEEVLEVYQNDPTTIANVLNDVSHGNFAKVIHEVLKGKRSEHADDKTVHELTEKLYKAGEGKWGTDENEFNTVLTQFGPNVLQKVSHAYEEKHKHTLETAIKKETSGAYEDLLVALTQPSHVYYADRLYSATHGLGTDEHALNFIFGVLPRNDLREVMKLVQQRHKKSLEDLVKGDTSGNYRDLLTALLSEAH